MPLSKNACHLARNDTAQIRQFERMYDPASPSHHLGRESGTNLQMFGYYIFNNISIGFRTFASGLLFGVGAIYVLVFAAFVEAFWSSIGWMPSSVKYSVGGLVWLVVWYWIWRGGRNAA